MEEAEEMGEEKDHRVSAWSIYSVNWRTHNVRKFYTLTHTGQPGAGHYVLERPECLQRLSGGQ